MTRECPKCGETNPEGAEYCGCGQKLSNRPTPPVDPLWDRKRKGYIAGIIGFTIMSGQGLVSTLDPRPDGRFLNTAPALGVDVFLFVGLIGIAYCARHADSRAKVILLVLDEPDFAGGGEEVGPVNDAEPVEVPARDAARQTGRSVHDVTRRARLLMGDAERKGGTRSPRGFRR